VSSAVITDNSLGTALVIPIPSGVAAGNFMLAIMAAQVAETFTGDTGWNEIADYGSNPGLRAAWKLAGGSEPSSYTFTASISSTKSRKGLILAGRALRLMSLARSARQRSPILASRRRSP
jgi:hypothetical protein